MSILIKGMEIPMNCRQCNLYLQSMDSERNVYENCAVTAKSYNWGLTTLPSDCPLVPVPPHGRLIDADEFLKRAIGTKCFHGDYALMLDELVGESTTIIPAEEGE